LGEKKGLVLVFGKSRIYSIGLWLSLEYVTPRDDLGRNKKGSQKEAQPSPTFIVGTKPMLISFLTKQIPTLSINPTG
jgi:hypothetical protein